MDFNRLYFDHQLSLIRARSADTNELRRDHQRNAASIATRIGREQGRLSATAACAWMASGEAAL
ncbi:MAG TPA: hypothetical protein VL100_10915 [Croceibacterium sp.]|nr:hypothetical protein [Croceibacterium sp.]